MSRNKVPSRTFSLFLAERKGTPFKNCLVLRGGGPPSCFRALEKVVQGVPKWASRTQPLAIHASIFLRRAGSSRSAEAKLSPSTLISTGGRVDQPAFFIALVNRAFPAKISTNHGRSL